MYKWILSTLLVVAIVLGAGVLYQNIDEYVKATETEKKEAGTTLKISAHNFAFDQPTYTVKQGETLTVKFMNTEGLHAMEIEGYNVKLDKSSNSASVTFDKPGNFKIRCVLSCGQGHDTMVSDLVVEG